MRETYVIRDGKLVPKHLAPPRNTGRVHGIISDSMDALRHPITGKPMDSKSEFRKVTRAHGCVEVGNETQKDTRRLEGFDSKTRTKDIAQAIQELGG